MEYIKGLNTAQKEAVMHTEGPLLIVAGAGAGKTRTITHRIVHLISLGVRPEQILAVTFTNKAAGEMRERIETMLGRRLPRFGAAAGPLVTTFHSLGTRLLREFADEAGISRSFVIWDRDDSARALKRILQDLGLESVQPRAALSTISRAKGDGVNRAEFTNAARSWYEENVAKAWERYDAVRAESNALDFSDLLFHTLRLLKENEAVRTALQKRWRHITVDEYQDTNRAQYEIMRHLAGENNNVCVVGDLDQCLVAGTKITRGDGRAAAIEHIQKGDMVLSNHGSGDVRPARVTGVMRRTYAGALVSLMTAAGRTIISTPEHIHFVGYRLGITPQLYFTYLMRKQGVGWRLGVSQVYTKGQRRSVVGFVQRCVHEHADDVWIIATHTTPNDARVLEYKLSLRYGIPTLPFVARKGGSANGYVHDQGVLDAIFRSFDTEKGASDLLHAHHLSIDYPHHRAQSRNSNRRNIHVTLCADHRGATPMHHLAIMGNDRKGRDALSHLGLSIRRAKRGSKSWRFEIYRSDYAELRRIIAQIQKIFPASCVVSKARLGGAKKNLKDGNSLGLLPASSIRPGMALFDHNGAYDVVTRVEHLPESESTVYDLNVAGTHNFIANGIVTHNCIYSWNGADISNLLSFEKTFPGTKTVLLEENYRSTQTILTAANSVIEKNTARVPKKLTTQNETGEAIVLFEGASERDEAQYIVREARALLGSGVPASEIAVLFRENFQSRALEEACIAEGIPYRVLGVRFFERAEVKDVLAYIRAARNPRSRGDFARAAGSPSRGIGAQTLEKVFSGAEDTLAASARTKIANFRALLSRIATAIETKKASEAIHTALTESGLEKTLGESDEGRDRLANIFELLAHATRYDELPPPDGINHLLEDAALMSDQDELQKKKDAISLMTMHASKGLEFDAVFITGLEQGLFPSQRSEDRDPEEERRLFYVALTRARRHVFLTLARSRLKYGTREFTIPSEFLSDIDARLLSYADEQADYEPIIR